MTKPLGLAFIGLGMAHKPHVEALRNLSDKVSIVQRFRAAFRGGSRLCFTKAKMHCFAPSQSRCDAFSKLHPDLPISTSLDFQGRDGADPDPAMDASRAGGGLCQRASMSCWKSRSMSQLNARGNRFSLMEQVCLNFGVVSPVHCSARDDGQRIGRAHLWFRLDPLVLEHNTVRTHGNFYNHDIPTYIPRLNKLHVVKISRNSELGKYIMI